MDRLPSDLSQHCQDLAAEIEARARTVADYEVDYRQKQIELKRAIAKYTVRQKGVATPSVLKIMADSDGAVIEAQEEEQQAFATVTIGKAELDGLTARFQASKQALVLAIEELKAFKGVNR